ncbi:trypsin-like serine peptidase [Elusimicrobiota bacterium]
MRSIKEKHVIRILAGTCLCAVMFTVYAVAASIYQAIHILTQAQISMIFGEDDRLDLYQVKNPQLLKLADSTVAQFHFKQLELDPEKKAVHIKTETYGDSLNLCKGERYYDQPSGAICSGVLVGPDIMLTAGHCIKNESWCEQTRFVFGFAVKAPGESPKSIPENEVYACKNIIERRKDSTLSDWILLRLDREVRNHDPLELNASGNVNQGDPLVVMGHPTGLPLKIAGNARVIHALPEKKYFMADLDAFRGTSGGPVFNANTLLFEGLLIRAGPVDFVPNGDCNVAVVMPNEGDSEEEPRYDTLPAGVMRAEFIAKVLLSLEK